MPGPPDPSRNPSCLVPWSLLDSPHVWSPGPWSLPDSPHDYSPCSLQIPLMPGPLIPPKIPHVWSPGAPSTSPLCLESHSYKTPPPSPEPETSGGRKVKEIGSQREGRALKSVQIGRHRCPFLALVSSKGHDICSS